MAGNLPFVCPHIISDQSSSDSPLQLKKKNGFVVIESYVYTVNYVFLDCPVYSKVLLCVLASSPTFLEPVPNMTVVEGRDVTFPCVVDNLGNHRGQAGQQHVAPTISTCFPGHGVDSTSLPILAEGRQVAWIHTDRHTLITLHDRLITRGNSHKYGVTHQGRTWWLHIMDVEEKDSGEYMCQVNTSPMKSQVGYLEVEVPPRLMDHEASNDVEVREGSPLSLHCRARGNPEPTVVWRREHGGDLLEGVKTGRVLSPG
ncbi:LSAMP [Cordylochernes scorpioides]|uniref:LSAMP n=1 Tax=Cordylochernes scorpioides TaxID=51811 RepID=A0ABY6KV66_9ARAC|nr:LSAMP [Cordylochernes scorpioides]